MLISIVLILVCGFAGGQLVRQIGAPPLIGMILVGIIIGPEIAQLIAPTVLNIADDLRAIAVMVILMRAGLGLDRDKLIKQSSVAIRLGFLPALTEAIAVAAIAMVLFKFNWLTGLLLGCVVGAESPAVIVPGMLRLKSLGWGVGKGIPDVILTGSALSDVLVLLLFSLLTNFLVKETVSNSQVWLLPLQVIMQIVLGVIIGYALAQLIVWITLKQKWIQNPIQTTLIVVTLALLVIILSQRFPYFSGYLATMAMGFFIIELDPPLARQLRIEFNHLWVVAEIVLFVLLGASIQLQVLENNLIKGILLLAIALLVGRTIGWYLATLGSDWNIKEKLFLLPGNSAKATVQAAIGAIPLSLGIEGGDIILAIAALAILITAPLGAWAIPTFAPKLLTQDAVDPTKVAIVSQTTWLAIIDLATVNQVLKVAADLARRSNGKVIILYPAELTPSDLARLKHQSLSTISDLRHQFISLMDITPQQLVQLQQEYGITNVAIDYSKFLELNLSSILDTDSFPITLI